MQVQCLCARGWAVAQRFGVQTLEGCRVDDRQPVPAALDGEGHPGSEAFRAGIVLRATNIARLVRTAAQKGLRKVNKGMSGERHQWQGAQGVK
ncbi:hypothetical protein HaLaN_11880 [Haematococcus lacustris]|uniref:Uncharacterized protein n=1 Tax=Haematococcus lacustris TaxID=44745 RepID=A0A699Z8U9_HAELA|nr:hypothetical protein HaLaN_11880 [Haematococcus lacustris]